MAGIFGERRRQEDLDEAHRVLDWMVSPADTDDLRIVVLARKSGGLVVPSEGGAGAPYRVRSHLLAVARAADHDAEAARIADRASCRLDTERRVVVLRVVGERPAVHDVVAEGGQVREQVGFELEACVVAT